MDKRATIFGTTSLAAILALFFGISRSPVPVSVQAAASSERERIPPSSRTCPNDTMAPSGVSATDLLGDFFDTTLASALDAGEYARKAWSLDVLVATIPDPMDSHLDWGFDFDLEAIRRAHERVGYVLDRFWLPWTEPRDTIARTVCRGRRQIWQRYPGVMLFRAPTQGKLHVLYLIGEIPTSGIQKEAFSRALDESHDLTASVVPPVDTIRVVGPLFSGSATSLRIASQAYLSQPQNKHHSISIVTGSATDASSLAELRNDRMTIAATVNPISALSSVLKERVLTRLGIGQTEVAVLREASTAYGQSTARTTVDLETQEIPIGVRAPPDSFLVIPFPMNISSLRTEYQRHPELDQRSQTLPALEGPARLPVDLQEPAGYTETPPVMSHLTPSALDLQLDQIAGVIRENRIRAVGIIGTDVRDRLFLAEEVRKRVRDVQLFTYVSNVLLASAQHWRWLRGTIVLSTYPMVAQNQAWTAQSTGDDRQRILALSDASEGTYNATLVQLGHGDLALDYAMPFAQDTAKGRKPPVWISVVGRRAVLPLAVDTTYDSFRVDASFLQRITREGAGHETTQQAGLAGSLIWLMLMTTGLGLLLIAVWLVRRRRRRQVTGPNQEDDIPGQPSAGSGLRFQERLYVALVVIALLGTIVPTISLLGRARKADIELSWDWLLALVLALVPLTIFAIRVLPSAIDPRRRREEQIESVSTHTGGWRAMELALEGVIVAVALAYLVLIVLFSWHIVSLDKRDAVFLFYRATAIDSGVSPLLPAILIGAAFILWCWWHHERIYRLHNSTEFEFAAFSLETSGARVPAARFTDHLEHGALVRASKAVRQVRAHLSKLMPDRSGGLLFTVLLIAALIVGFMVDRTLETIAFRTLPMGLSSFDLLLRIGLLTTLIVTAWSVYRFYRVWKAFSLCLQSITLTPLISAFDRLPQRLSRVSRLTLFDDPSSSHPENTTHLQKQHLRTLFAQCTPEITSLAASHPNLTSELTTLMSEPASPRPSDRLGHSFTALYEVLRGFWRMEPTAEELSLVARDVGRYDAPTESVKQSTSGKFRRTFIGSLGLWVRAAEEFAASQVVEYIDWVLHHLRRLALFITLSLVLISLLISSYPFHPQSMIQALFFILVVASIVTLVAAMLGLSRDELLSRIAKTTPGDVTWDTRFVLNLALFGAVPLLALMSSEIPGVREFLLGWVEPLLRALK